MKCGHFEDRAGFVASEICLKVFASRETGPRLVDTVRRIIEAFFK